MLSTVMTKYGALEGVRSNAGFSLFHGLDFMRLAGCESIAALRRLPWEVLVDALATYHRTHSFREGFNVYADGWI